MRKTLWLCSVGVLAACAPVYQTHYTLLPPATREGRACANGCLYMNTTCINNCRQMKLECNWARQSAMFDDGYGYRQHLSMNAPLYDDCNAYACIENCNAAVRACHINCGGTIQATSVCTANCDEPGLPPPPVPPAPGAIPLD